MLRPRLVRLGVKTVSRYQLHHVATRSRQVEQGERPVRLDDKTGATAGQISAINTAACRATAG